MNGFWGTFGALISFAVAAPPRKLGTREGPLGGSLGIGVAASAADTLRSEPTRTAARNGAARRASERAGALLGAGCCIGPPRPRLMRSPILRGIDVHVSGAGVHAHIGWRPYFPARW